jgi:hypothetical protein
MPRFFIKPLKARSRASSLAQISGLAMMPLLVSGAAIAGPSNALVEALRLQQQQQGQAQGRAQTQTQAALTQGQAKVDTVMVDWRMLGGLNYESGEMTDTLKKLHGKVVKIPGFIVPLEDYEEEAAEFLLVPYFGACVHTPPPPPNQLVYVKMTDKKKLKVGLWDAVWMYGTLKIEYVESVYGPASYTLDGLRTAPYGEH